MGGTRSPNEVRRGWYPDPWGQYPYRWWDGYAWTSWAGNRQYSTWARRHVPLVILAVFVVVIVLPAGFIVLAYQAGTSAAPYARLADAAPAPPGGVLDDRESYPGGIDTRPSASVSYLLPGTADAECMPVYDTYLDRYTLSAAYEPQGKPVPITDETAVAAYCASPLPATFPGYDLIATPRRSSDGHYLEITLGAPVLPRGSAPSEVVISAQ